MKYLGLWVLMTVALTACQKAGATSGQLPEGEILYYQESRQGKGNLVVLDLKTGKRKQIGSSGSRPDHFPSWSADGQKIAFESYRKGGWHVWVCDADGGNVHRLSDLPSNSTRHYEFDPGFAPDNKTVVFLQGDDLWKGALGRPTPVRITEKNNGIDETAPTYSPDGRWIAIAGYDLKTKAWDIYTLSHDGQGLRALTQQAGTNLAPSWSPDGEHILFYSNRSGSFELYEMTREGKEARPIFSDAQRKTAGFEQTAVVDPWDNDWGATEQYKASYSPDGQWIVFSRDIEGDRELFISRRDGTKLSRITHRPGLDGQPAWRPR